MNITDIKNGLQSIIQTQSGVTTIFANQNAPVPDKPFITLLLTTTNKLGHDVSSQTSDTQETVTGQRELDVSIQAFGDTSYQILLDLQDSFESVGIRESLAAFGLVYVSNEAVTNADETLETTIEHRALMSVLFRTDSTKIYNNGIIEQVDTTHTIYNPDGSVADNQNYLIG